MKKTRYILSSLFIVAIFFTSCEKNYTDPTIKEVPVGAVKTIADVRAMYEPGKTVYITEDISVFGIVTMDETTGNLYKESYITDATGNLYIRFISGSGLFIGDSIRINLNGAKILKYNQMLQVDSLHPDNSVVKLATQKFKSPEVTTIAALNTNLDAAQGKLVQLDNVRFVNGGQGKTFADAATQTAVSWDVQDLNGDLMEVRTSGYANFANDTLPGGVGSFIGIVAQYNNGLQLLVRDPNELIMTGVAPVLVLSKDFDDQSLTSGGWSSQTIIGGASCDWGIFASTNSAAKVSNNSNLVCESWLISPAIDLTGATNASMEFRNTIRFDVGPQLELIVSTDYDGVSAPSTATWTSLTAAVSANNGWDTDAGSWNFISSGSVDLSAFTQAGVYVAFKFIGTNSTSVTWEVDEIKVYK